MSRGSKPGERRGGRQKGTPNKTTASIKAAITEAFERAGGVEYLVEVARTDPRTFCGLVGKIVPTQLEMGVTDALADLMKEVDERRAAARMANPDAIALEGKPAPLRH